MEGGFKAVKSGPLARKGARRQTAEVQLGDKREVALIAPRDLAVTLPRASRNSEIKVSVAYNGPIKAPIARGQHIADLVIRTPDMPPQRLPLVAAERSEEHTSELQSLMRISYAVFCLKKKNGDNTRDNVRITDSTT